MSCNEPNCYSQNHLRANVVGAISMDLVIVQYRASMKPQLFSQPRVKEGIIMDKIEVLDGNSCSWPFCLYYARMFMLTCGNITPGCNAKT